MDFIFRWETLWYLMLILYIPSCIGLIVIVLLQKGKGVGFAGAFGIGAGSDTVFGPRMSKSLPQKLTYVMAAVFMVMAFTMSLISGRLGKGIAPEKASETTSAPADLSGLPDLGKAVEGGTASVTPGETSQGGTVSVTPGEPAKPGEGGTVTVTPSAPAAPGAAATPPQGGTVSVTPAAPPAPEQPAPVPAPTPAPAAPEQHQESTPAPAGS